MSFARVEREAGFTKVELASLYGVSRQTIHTWAGGASRAPSPPRPGSYTARMEAVITRALCAALDKRMLPLGAMDKAARAARIQSMARTLQNLKPATLQ